MMYKKLSMPLAWMAAFFLLAAATPAPAPKEAKEEPAAPVSKHAPLPAILYETGMVKSDLAFNDAAQAGARRAREEMGIMYDEFRLPENEDRETFIRSVADSGAPLIVAVGFHNVVPVLKIAEHYPDTKFTVIDGMVPQLYNNVQSIIFKDHEGAFLVGMIAAMTSKTGTIGFIGGMDVPLIRNFSYGYIQGAEAVKSNIKVLRNMIGTTREAWSNPEKAAQLAREQYEKGADVIFAAAGGSGLGVLDMAEKMKKLAIGVDTNQNGLHPGYVLTSLVKRVDNAVYEAFKTYHQNNWQPGIKYLGLREGALDFSVDTHNKALLNNDMIETVETAEDKIIRGLLTVKMYSPN